MSALAAEAQRLLDDAQLENSEVPTYPTEADTLAAAQVVATLALVEQVRIANIAAIANVDPFVELDEAGNGITSALLVRLNGDDWAPAEHRLRPEIAIALGITQEEPTHDHHI